MSLKVEEIDAGNSTISEVVLADGVECMDECGRCESVIVVAVCTADEGERSVRENGGKMVY